MELGAFPDELRKQALRAEEVQIMLKKFKL